MIKSAMSVSMTVIDAIRAWRQQTRNIFGLCGVANTIEASSASDGRDNFVPGGIDSVNH
jgi:hypothetical protein